MHRHWGEGECGERGDGHDDTHHPAELLEQYACHARNHGQREEHGNHGECGCDNGNGNLLCGMHSRLLRRRPSFNVRRHVLQYHNGIVHDVTDGDGETRQGNHVERTTRSIQIDE